MVTIVYPDAPDWFRSTPGDSWVAIIDANPRAGSGSAFINESRTFGTLGMLSSLSFEWFVDPASSSSLPPEIALRVYPYGDRARSS